MPRELIFTSVPSGISPGSTGYCTVAKHKGIDRLLDQAIEEICFYEMMNSTTKPVVHAYRILRLNTGTFHVLTRISFSGSDHTGRTNYLAHNLIFDQAETYMQTVSPAEIFLSGAGWLSAWPKGAPPAFLNEDTCKVLLPTSSSIHSSLQTWNNFTGNGNLAHELGGRGQWKFLTQGGEYQSALSLIAEFASLPGTPNRQLCWNQLTFTTYLQPSDKPEHFKIVCGEANSSAFSVLARDTLDLSSPGAPWLCFSAAGSSTFGALPALNQPSEAKVEPRQPDAPASDQSVAAQGAALDPFAEDEPVDVAGIPSTPKVSNFNHGPTDLSTKETGPTDLPTASKPYQRRNYRTVSFTQQKKSKAPIILLSIAGIGLLAAVVFAAILLFPDKAGSGTEDEVVQSDDGAIKTRSKQEPEGSGQTDGSNIAEDTTTEQTDKEKLAKEQKDRANQERITNLETFLAQNSIEKLHNKELEKIVELKTDLEEKINAMRKAELEIPAKADVYKKALISLITNKRNAQHLANEAKNTKLPQKILIDDKFLPKGDFSLIPSGEPSQSSTVYVYKAGQVSEKGEQPFPPAFWVSDQNVYLLEGQTYQIKKGRFRNIKNFDEYGIISPAKGIPQTSNKKLSLTGYAVQIITRKSGAGVQDGNTRRSKNFWHLVDGYTVKCEKLKETGQVFFKVASNGGIQIDIDHIQDIYQTAKPRIDDLRKRATDAETKLDITKGKFKDFVNISRNDQINFGDHEFEKMIQDKLVAKIGAISFEWEDDDTKEKKTSTLPAGWEKGEKVKKSLVPNPKQITKATFPTFRSIFENLVEDKKEGWQKQLNSAKEALKKAKEKLSKNTASNQKKPLENAIKAAEKDISAKRKLESLFRSKYSNTSSYDEQKQQYSELRKNLVKFISDKNRLPSSNSIPELEAFIDKLGILSEPVKTPWHWREKEGNRIILEVID
jgi:hypothetical protein